MPKLNRFKQKQHFLYFAVAVLSFLFMCHFPGLMLSALFLSFMKRNVKLYYEKCSKTIRIKSWQMILKHDKYFFIFFDSNIQFIIFWFFTLYSLAVMFIIQPIIPLSNISNSFRKHEKNLAWY